MRSLSCGGKHLYPCGIRSPQLGPQATNLGLRFPNSPTSGPAFSTTSLQGPDDVQSQALQESVTAALSAWPVHQIANFHSPDISPPLTTPAESTTSEIQRSGSEAKTSKALDPRLPRSVQAIYLKPLKRRPKYGLPACDLQLRSYSVRNLEFFTDFALRAAYYLYLPAAGPVPLPRMKERWTVPRSPFIHNSSQENFERITLRRLIQIQDGNTETVEIWLAFLRKHAYYGIGMKANVWGYEKLGSCQSLKLWSPVTLAD